MSDETEIPAPPDDLERELELDTDAMMDRIAEAARVRRPIPPAPCDTFGIRISLS